VVVHLPLRRHCSILPYFKSEITDYDLKLCSDASGKGIGAHFMECFFSFSWEQVQAAWPWTKGFRSINEKELLAVMASVAFWGHRWPKGCVIVFRCDNMSSIRWHTRDSAPTFLATEMLKWIYWTTATLGVQVKLIHLAGRLNIYSDALSRFQIEKFKQLYKRQCSKFLQRHLLLPDSIPSSWPSLDSSTTKA
jgi:hypothetical protein